MTIVAEASPSLALVKYWGKQPSGINLAATPSVAVTLGALHSRTRIAAAEEPTAGRGIDEGDTVLVDGVAQTIERFRPVIDGIRSRAAKPCAVRVESSNDFPTAAGLASSSSGLAALAVGLDAYFDTGLSREELSALARLGSGSACRAIFGGFTTWDAGAEAARDFLPADHWDDLRVIIVVLQQSKKSVSSREGMERSRLTSPYYAAWIASSSELFSEGCRALEHRDIERLGWAMRQSYLAMFGTMFTADPPVIYWLPESVAVIRLCEHLRSNAVPVWETMDAGPQVKLVTLADSVGVVSSAIRERVPGAETIVSAVGSGPTVTRTAGGSEESDV
jgi:diphosphomevalonate decarboxylase